MREKDEADRLLLERQGLVRTGRPTRRRRTGNRKARQRACRRSRETRVAATPAAGPGRRTHDETAPRGGMASRHFPSAAGEGGTACRGLAADARDQWRAGTTPLPSSDSLRGKRRTCWRKLRPRCPQELVPRSCSKRSTGLASRYRGRAPVSSAEALIAGDLLSEQHEAPQRNGAVASLTAAAAAGSDSGAQTGPSWSLGPCPTNRSTGMPCFHHSYSGTIATGSPPARTSSDQLAARLPVMTPPRE